MGFRCMTGLCVSPPISRLVFGRLLQAARGRLRVVLWLACAVAIPSAAANPTAIETDLARDEHGSAAVQLDGRELFRVKGTAVVPAKRRAQLIADRLQQVAQDPAIPVNRLDIRHDGELTRIYAGTISIAALGDFDAEGMPRQRIAELLVIDLQRALVEYRHAREPRVLLANSGYALLITGLAAALLYGVVRLRRWGVERLGRRFIDGQGELKFQSVPLIQSRQLWLAVRALVNLGTTLTMLVVAYLHLSSVLRLYPWTRQLADDLFQLFLRPLQVMGHAILGAVPDLAFVLVLVLIARYVLRALHLLFEGLQTGAVRFEGFDPEWAQPTYKIVRILVVAFTVVVAYPYIPGSDSQAFKGVSLFLGVIFSLGSSSVISNVIAGYTMTYRRAFRLGDRIQVGDVTGFVTEASLLVTRVRSVKNEEIVIPNSQILNGAVTNYSALAREDGVILHTTVGIGYETPWRQVEAMLLLAADRADGAEKSPPPYVLQKSLGDFCVVYEINAYCRDPGAIARTYTELHRNILDVFNEYGVQIMTPAYEGDPAVAKVVPRDQWFLGPATPPPAASDRR
jgi:small-conductance mechanosensitive channel